MNLIEICHFYLFDYSTLHTKKRMGELVDVIDYIC